MGRSLNAPGAGALLDGRYRLGPMIARGGMSTVHRGTDTRLDRPVAIKVMDPRLAGDPAFRTRFEREARSAARIDHPAVVDVHDQGEHIGPEPVLFLVMELVEGGTLRDVLRARGALGVPAAFAVLEPVLAGLAQAHRLGLVHRDVKPENVLISRTGEVKVADFGLVTAAAQAGASHVGMIMGTVAYLSPEQVTTGAADSRSDVYAAGILLYELLTGVPPYTGDTSISVAFQHVNSSVTAPSLVAGDVPPELDALVLRATDRDPAGRFADADALLEALRELRERLNVPRVSAPIPPPLAEQDTVPSYRRNGTGTVGPRGTAVYRAPSGTAGYRAAGGTAAHGLPGGYGGPGGTRTMPRSGTTGLLPAADQPAAASTGHGRSRRMFAAWVAVVIALGLLVALLSWWLGTGRWTVMPSVVGLDRAAAEQVLTEAELVAVITPAFYDDIAAGIVAGADPAPAVEVLRGSEVRLTVSGGRPVVPEIAPGTAVAVAEQQVRDAGLTPVQDTGDRDNRGRGSDEDNDGDRGRGSSGFDEDLPTGSVLRTDPKPGTVLAVDAPVALVLNVEEELVIVPFLIGRSADDARDELKDRDLRATVQSQLPFLRGDGTVISMSPGPGTRVEPGTTVVLTTL